MRSAAAFPALLLAGALMLSGFPAKAATGGEARLDNPALEARARVLFTELRCMVCQNQSLADSDAELARDLRALVRQRLAQGDTDAEVRAFLAARYGDFILLKPPVKPQTYLLWLGPPFLLLAGGLAIFLFLRRSPPHGEAAALSEAEQAQLSHLLEDERDT